MTNEEIITQESLDSGLAVLGEPAKNIDTALLEEMMKAGLYIGLRSSKTYPKMRQFIAGVRIGISVIDLTETVRLLEVAMEFVKSKIQKNGVVLMVGTTPAAKSLVLDFAKRLKFPYVTERWLGGTLTNFKTISKRIAYFKKLKSDKESGRLDKYTKKERLNFDREIAKMQIMFSGLENMEAPPQVLFAVDVNAQMIAVREAKLLKIPVIGILSTDTNPELVDFPIPANTRSKTSTAWVLDKLEKAVEEARNAAVAVPKV